MELFGETVLRGLEAASALSEEQFTAVLDYSVKATLGTHKTISEGTTISTASFIYN